MITKKVRDEIRKRAKSACEYCGITENDIGGQLTVDHFHPQSKGGDDHSDNLIYCCHRCNSYKSDYFPEKEGDPKIWNPRIEAFENHFFELDDGKLKGLTPTGNATIVLLRLNRRPLVQYRLNKKAREEEIQLLKHYQQLVGILQQTNQELTLLLENQQQLLERQQQLLKFLLDESTDEAE
jgi:hypothetical protein